MKLEVRVNSDYMIADTPNGSFYYGYEVTSCKDCGEIGDTCCEKEDHDDSEWCFKGNYNGLEMVIPFSKLGQTDQFSMESCFIAGMVLFFTRND